MVRKGSRFFSGARTFFRSPVQRTTLSKIILASPTLSTMTEVNLGDGRLMSSRASRTAAMIDAAMTSVDANLSRFCRSASSLAMARRISPITAPPFLI